MFIMKQKSIKSKTVPFSPSNGELESSSGAPGNGLLAATEAAAEPTMDLQGVVVPDVVIREGPAVLQHPPCFREVLMISGESHLVLNKHITLNFIS